MKDISDVALYAYVGLIVLYRAAETVVMRAVGSLKKRPRRDWTMALIVVPYYLVMVGPLIEYLYSRWEPGWVHGVSGTIGFAAAICFRAKGHLDLREGFSMAIETSEESQLVETGLYATIRHPLYLGNLFLFVACPLFLAARISWVFMVLGMVGVVARIQIEEAFLLNNLPAYGEYKNRTWALIPGIY